MTENSPRSLKRGRRRGFERAAPCPNDCFAMITRPPGAYPLHPCCPATPVPPRHSRTASHSGLATPARPAHSQHAVSCQIRLSRLWIARHIVTGCPQNAMGLSFPLVQQASLDSWKPHSHQTVPLPTLAVIQAPRRARLPLRSRLPLPARPPLGAGVHCPAAGHALRLRHGMSQARRHPGARRVRRRVKTGRGPGFRSVLPPTCWRWCRICWASIRP